MSRISRIWKTTAVLAVAIIAAFVLLPMTASLRGRAAARRDISRGHYVLLGYGLPAPWRGEYARLLHERYGIEFKPVAGCIVSQTLLDYVSSYDNVVIDSANHKFGRDVFEETSEEARNAWKRDEERSRNLKPASANTVAQ
jgi:hypothetical protein